MGVPLSVRVGLAQSSSAHLHQGAGLESSESVQQLRQEPAQGIESVIDGYKHHYSHRQFTEILLELDVLIGGKEDMEPTRGGSKQLAVLKTRPTVVGHG